MTDETTAVDGEGVSEKKRARPATLSIRSLVPRSGWVLLAWSLLLLVACDTVIAAAWFQQSIPEPFRGPYTVVFGLDSATAGTWMTSLLLLVAAQLALVIGWVRGHCLTDFDGRYRAWTRVALSWLVIAGVVGTGAHQSMSQMLLAQFGFETLWQREILSWLLPLAALVASVAWVMDGEMKTSRTARLLMWTAASAAIGGLVLVLEPTLIDAALLERFPQLVAFLKLAAMVSAAGLLVVSMGVFLSYVVHVSPEPAPRRRWRSKRKGKRAKTTDGVESDELSDEEAAEEEEEDEEEYEYEEYAEEEEAEEEVEEEVEEGVEEGVEEDAYAYSEYADSSQDSYQDDGSHYRIDEAESEAGYSSAFPDPEALKGLSKRERRRLRKQWRERQRQQMDG